MDITETGTVTIAAFFANAICWFYIESDKEIQVEQRKMAVIGIKPRFYKYEEPINRGYIPSFRIVNYPKY